MTSPISPRAKAIAQELGIDLEAIVSVGGRIRSRDVWQHVSPERDPCGEHQITMDVELESTCELLHELRSNPRAHTPAPKIGDIFACCVSVALDATPGLLQDRQVGAIMLTTPLRWRRIGGELQSLRDIAAQLEGLETSRLPAPRAGQPEALVVDTHRWGVSALQLDRPIGVKLVACLETPNFKYPTEDFDPSAEPFPWQGMKGKVHLTVAASLDLRRAMQLLDEVRRLLEDPRWMLSL